jgi:YHS domain-containing protein
MDEPANLALSVPTDDGPVYFCCEGCIPKYQKDPGKYAAKVAAQRKALAGKEKVQVICPVLKKPVDQKVFVESNGKKVYFCCKGCVGKYQSNPAKYAAALANSYSYQTTCPVMGGKINPQVSTTLSTGETIYYCCPGCDKPLRDNPAKYNKNLVAQGILVNWAEVKKAESGKGHDGHDHGAHGHGDHDHGG